MKTKYDEDDSTVLADLKRGDKQAFTYLYHKFKAQLYTKIIRLVRVEHVAEEIHQEVFMRLWNYRHSIDVSQSIVGYLATIARNQVIDFYKKAARDKKLLSELLDTSELMKSDPEESMAFKETREMIERIVSLLPPQRQRIYRFIKFENKSYEAASEFFNVSIGTINDHMIKANKFVRMEVSRSYQGLIIGLLATFFTSM